MAKIIAQATTPNSGASKASDFQPTTRNPQTAPAELFPENSNLQPTSEDQLLQNSHAQITVPHNPALPAPQTKSPSNSSSAIFIAVLAVVIVLVIIRLWRRRAPAVTVMATIIPEAIPPVETKPKPSNTNVAKSAAPKPKAKKSKSKRKNKSRR